MTGRNARKNRKSLNKFYMLGMFVSVRSWGFLLHVMIDHLVQLLSFPGSTQKQTIIDTFTMHYYIKYFLF